MSIIYSFTFYYKKLK